MGSMESFLALRREREQAILAGICVAFSRRYGVDLLLVRLAVVLLGLSSGLGVVVYLWAWSVLPTADGQPALVERWWPGAGEWSAQTKTVIGAVLALFGVAIGANAFPWGVAPAAVLLGAVMVARHQAGQRPASPRGTPSNGLVVGGRRRPLRRAVLAAITSVAALSILAGGVAALWPREGIMADERVVAYASVGEIPAERQNVTAANVTYDLSSLPSSADGQLSIRATAASVTIVVPDEANVQVTYSLSGSEMSIGANQMEPFSESGSHRGSWPTQARQVAIATPPHQLHIVVDARASTVRVHT